MSEIHSFMSNSLWPMDSMEFSRQEYWSGYTRLPSEDLPHPEIESRSPALQMDSLPSDPPRKPSIYTYEYMYYIYICLLLLSHFSYLWLFVTLWTCIPPGSSVHGILQARILVWVAMPSSRGPSNPGIKPRSPALQVDSLPAEPQGKPENIGVGSLSFLQGIFLTQEQNWYLLHCRQILYQLSYGGSPH